MKKNLLLLPFLAALFAFASPLVGQNNVTPFCGGDQVMQQYLSNPTHQNRQNGIEEQIRRYLNNPAVAQSRSPNMVVTLPVVVHIVHNGGAENVSNAQILKGIQDLNDAFGNRGYYDPTTGVNTDIQFCLAQRDPNNQTSNGITRNVSPLTNMTWEMDDINLKNINRWQPTCYINIWLVKEVNSSSSGSDLVGYAYYPSAHGTDVDGIVMEARWFGTSPANSSVVVHEMGHYLGLYHTFNGGCGNANCLTDGDQVCDTPPDQSQGVGCSPNANSCTTDAEDPSVNNPFRAVGLGGRGDVADMGENYMDYSPLQCYSIFTAGQKERMDWYIQNVRQSLLACKSCELPCPSLVSASFSPRGQTVDVGTALSFTSTSTNATTYKWRVGSTNYTTQNIRHFFNTVGSFSVVFEAANADARCSSALDSVKINVVCPIKAQILPPLSNSVKPDTPVIFKASVQNATTTEWAINNATVGTDTVLTYTFNAVGSYDLLFIASNSFCADTQRLTVIVSNSLPIICNNLLFSKTYKTARGNLVLTAIAADKNNTFIAVGVFNDPNNTDIYRVAIPNAFILRLDSIGHVLWAKHIVIYNNNALYNNLTDIKPTKDGGYIAVGSMNNLAGLIKFSSAGDVEWNRTYSNPQLYPNAGTMSVIQTKDDGIALIINRLEEFAVAKFSSIGTAQWAKEILLSGASTISNRSQSLKETEEGDLLVVANTTVTTNNYVLKLRGSTGEFIWKNQYTSGATEKCCNHSFNDVEKTADGGFIVGGAWSVNGAVLMKGDSGGAIVWTKSIKQNNRFLLVRQILQTPDGGYLLTLNDNFFLTRRIILKLNRDFRIQWQKDLPETNDYNLTRKGICSFSNGSLGIASNQGDLGFYVHRLDALGAFCDTIPSSTVEIEDLTSAVTSLDANIFNIDFNRQIPVKTVELTVFPTSQCKECKEVCNNGVDDDSDGLIDEADVVDCPCRVCYNRDSLKMVGLDTLCIGAKVDYKVQGFKCTELNPFWLLFTPNALLPTVIRGDSATNDTFRFRKSGVYSLVVNNTADSCPNAQFSLRKRIYVIGEPPVLELGTDKSVCKTGVFTFNAKRGFKSYLWQDGSTDSTFTAFNIGKYWVRVQDSCGGVQSDTIRVNLAASPPLNLSPDTFRICEGDSLVINAPTGFTSYRWSPSTGINDTFQQQITLTPSVSGTYYCVASTAQGCVNQDSITVEVAPRIQLVKDETLCGGTYRIGDSAFSKSGSYRVILRGRATACDTVIILHLRINELKIRTKVFNTCPNQRKGRIVAMAQDGTLPFVFSWNTGIINSELTNLAAGTYRLTVTDANNCTDTTSVIIKETPQYAYSFSVKNPKCYGDPTGEIRLNSTAKLTFGFDSTASNKTGFVANLRADKYNVFVKDSNNCVFSQTISITQPPPLTLVLQADTVIRLGDSLRIKSDANGGTGGLKYRWQPIEGLNCDTCKTVVAKPKTGILYTLVVTDSAGCTTNEKLRIDVNKVCKIFIPNVFSPFSSDGTNDTFYPFGDICTDRVAIMQIFDRWGENVFQKVNFPLNDAASGWDGTFKGKELNPNVFTYRIDIQLIDGRVERFVGNVTLLR